MRKWVAERPLFGRDQWDANALSLFGRRLLNIASAAHFTKQVESALTKLALAVAGHRAWADGIAILRADAVASARGTIVEDTAHAAAPCLGVRAAAAASSSSDAAPALASDCQ